MKRGKTGKRLLVGLAWTVLLTLLLGVAGGLGLLWYHGQDLPNLITVEDYQPPRASSVLARDGTVLARFGIERRTLVPMDRIPKVMQQAIVASEDAEFYSHKGLDYISMLRALIVMIRQGGRITQGGSTITQQLVKTLILTPERTLSRKAKEILLARQLEANLTKDEILYLYLNQVYMGHGCYGVEEASRYFFDHGAEALTLGEAALLAGLVQSPERLSPIRHKDAARSRRHYVLNEMVKCGYVDEASAQRIDSGPLGVVERKGSEQPFELAPHFVEAVRLQVQRELGQQALLEGGLQIHTTLDPGLQRLANQAVIAGLDRVDARQKLLRVPHRNPAKAARLLAEELRRRDGKAPPAGRVVRGVVAGVEPEREAYLVDLGGTQQGRLEFSSLARYAQPGKGKKEPVTPASLFTVGDVLRVRVVAEGGPQDPLFSLQPALGPEGALVALEPQTREVLALVGGDPRLPGRFDRVLQARRQPGSVFKPFVYAAALGLRRKDLTLATLIDDSPSVYVGEDGQRWSPRNYDGKFRGPIRMREALADSVNMVAIRLLKDVGVARVVSLAHEMGITSSLDPYLSLALGSSAVRPLELVNAYATLAAGGKFADPLLVRRIVGPDGGLLAAQIAELVQTVPADLSCLTTDALTSVVQEGTGARAKKLGRPVAGKTGTTNDGTDAWFAGYVPSLATVVWVGHDDNFTLGKGEQGAQTALPIWVQFMEGALREKPAEPFPPCSGIVERLIDRKTGLLAPEGHPEAESLRERFLEGTEPVDTVTLPGELGPDNFLLQETGRPTTAADSFAGPPEPPSPSPAILPLPLAPSPVVGPPPPPTVPREPVPRPVLLPPPDDPDDPLDELDIPSRDPDQPVEDEEDLPE